MPKVCKKKILEPPRVTRYGGILQLTRTVPEPGGAITQQRIIYPDAI